MNQLVPKVQDINKKLNVSFFEELTLLQKLLSALQLTASGTGFLGLRQDRQGGAIILFL
jgi:hypothetical protein